MEYIREFMELFKQKTFNEVIEYINFLKNEIKHYPQTFGKIFKKELIPKIQKNT